MGSMLNIPSRMEGPEQKTIIGKPEITVSTKGIANGKSVYRNDGADFGPDTMLGATALGQYGPPFTQTVGLTEGFLYATTNSLIAAVNPGNYQVSAIPTFPSNLIAVCSPTPWQSSSQSGGNTAFITAPTLSSSGQIGDSSSSVGIYLEGFSFQKLVNIQGSGNKFVNCDFNGAYIGNVSGDFDIFYHCIFGEGTVTKNGITCSLYHDAYIEMFDCNFSGHNSNVPFGIYQGAANGYYEDIVCNDGYFTSALCQINEPQSQFINSGSTAGTSLIINTHGCYVKSETVGIAAAGTSSAYLASYVDLGIGNVFELPAVDEGNGVSNYLIQIGNSTSAAGGNYYVTAQHYVSGATANFFNVVNLASSGCLIEGTYENGTDVTLITGNSSKVKLNMRDISVGINSQSPTLSANPPVTATVYQNTNPYDIEIDLPVYATTAGTAGYVTVAKGSSSTPTAIGNQYVNGATSSTSVDIIKLRVPAGWYYEFTSSGVTFGTASVFAD